VTLGADGIALFGSERGFERVRPVVSLAVTAGPSTFVMGTLPRTHRASPPGDPRTLHGLLPPLQRETLFFERPHENGLAWTLRTPRAHSTAWLNWQRLNTTAHRERFDAGPSPRCASRGIFRCRSRCTSCTKGDSSTPLVPSLTAWAALPACGSRGR
jgi:hypothetical protein